MVIRAALKLAISLLIISFLYKNAQAKTNCKTHKVYCKIIKLQPRIDKEYAMKVSNFIYVYAKANNVSPFISVAIINQESSFRELHTYHTTNETKSSCDTTSCHVITTKQKTVADMTLVQINIRTAIANNFDIERLFSHDLEYAIKCHFKILVKKMKMCAHLDHAWACYHSKTPKFKDKYIKMVSRFI